MLRLIPAAFFIWLKIMLDNDETRCLGAGDWGRICERRELCDRYLTIEKDRKREKETGVKPWFSHASLLCRHPNFAYFIHASNR